MVVLSQVPNGAISARRCPSAAFFSKPKPPLFSNSRPRFPSRRSPIRPPFLALSSADADPPAPSAPHPSPSFPARDENRALAAVGDDRRPLEGVIRLEKPGISSRLVSAAQVGLLAGGDVLCLLVFAAVGRFSHGFPVLDVETLRTADPFIAGWVLSAYFLGGFGDDARGTNGSTKAIVAVAKSWAVGIPLGLLIRSAMSGHVPATSFILVAMGSTGILLIAWRALVYNLFSSGQSKQNDVYKRGSPFELFELLTSLVRRW